MERFDKCLDLGSRHGSHQQYAVSSSGASELATDGSHEVICDYQSNKIKIFSPTSMQPETELCPIRRRMLPERNSEKETRTDQFFVYTKSRPSRGKKSLV